LEPAEKVAFERCAVPGGGAPGRKTVLGPRYKVQDEKQELELEIKWKPGTASVVVA
jgi:hypothetical protein